MSTCNTPGSSTPKGPHDQSCVATPLDYINPEENCFDPDQPPDPDNGHSNDHRDLPSPGDPGDNGSANDLLVDDHPDGKHFIDAIMALSGSLRDLCQDPAPKSEKIKV